MAGWRERVRRVLEAWGGPLAGFVLIAGLSAFLWSQIVLREEQRIDTEIAITADQLRGRLEAWVADRIRVADRFRARLDYDPGVETVRFRGEALGLLEFLSGVQALNWIDSTGVIGIVVPEEGNRPALGRNLREHPMPETRAALERAERTGRPARSPLLHLYQGGRGFAVYLAVRDARGRLRGFVNVVFRTDRLVRACLGESRIGERYRFELTDGSFGQVYAGGMPAPRDRHVHAALRGVHVVDRDWTLRVEPCARRHMESHGGARSFVLWGGLAVALMAAVLLRMLGARRTALASQQRRTERILESTHDGYILADREGRFLEVNDAYARLVGWSREQLRGMSFQDVEAHFGPEALDRSIRDLQRRGRARFETAHRTKDGGTVDLEVSLSMLPDDPRQLAICFLRDISARKRAEAERARLARAAEQAAEAILITSTDGRIEYVNPAFEEMTGYARDEVLGETPRLLKSGRHDAAYYSELWRVLDRGEVWSGTFVNRRRDGSLYEVESTISPVRDAEGTVIHYVAVQRDVTYEKEMERRLRQSQKMEAIGRLAGGVAHDFNNLLTVISGHCELLAHTLPDGDARRADVDVIQRAGEQAAALTRQLLAFSRRQVLAPEVLDLNALVNDVKPLLARMIGEDVVLDVDLRAGQAWVRADPHQIQQVIFNLAANARDAMPGGGRLTVATSDAPGALDGDAVRLEFRDTGAGMDEQTRRQVFEPFFTTKGRGRGTGLGLATVYGIVNQSGGRIGVTSAPGAGTRFEVFLPKSREPPAGAPAAQPARTTPGGKETVLVVEDEPSVRELAVTVLRGAGYEALEAADAEAALARAGHPGTHVDLLLTDVVMPGLSGTELASRLTARAPGLCVLLMSGYAAAELGAAQAPYPLIEKPFCPEDLLQRVREVLDRSG